MSGQRGDRYDILRGNVVAAEEMLLTDTKRNALTIGRVNINTARLRTEKRRIYLFLNK
jgi:hypothetical protein